MKPSVLFPALRLQKSGNTENGKAFDFGKTLVPPFFALTEGLPEFIIEDIRGPKKQVV